MAALISYYFSSALFISSRDIVFLKLIKIFIKHLFLINFNWKIPFSDIIICPFNKLTIYYGTNS